MIWSTQTVTALDHQHAVTSTNHHQVERWINEGVNVQATDQVYISWGRRILFSPGPCLSRKHQTLLLQLLADYPRAQEDLYAVVQAMGSVKELFLRFFQHYEARRHIL